MSTAFDFLKSKGVNVQEANLFEDSDMPYCYSNILGDNGVPIGAGFGADVSTARKIAYSEFLERTTYINITKGSEATKRKWGCHLIPTGCGFAVGFNQRNAIVRSLGEAVERWVMSKWIDDNFQIDEVKQNELRLDKASIWFCQQFDQVRFFRKEVGVQFSNHLFRFEVGFSIALKGDGVFAGTSAQFGDNTLWQHALLESFRHLQVCRNNPQVGGFPENKVRYFAQNAKVALDQIEKAHKKNWPMPQVEFHHNESFHSPEFYMARTIVSGWQSWHLGPLARFLY